MNNLSQEDNNLLIQAEMEWQSSEEDRLLVAADNHHSPELNDELMDICEQPNRLSPLNIIESNNFQSDTQITNQEIVTIGLLINDILRNH